METEYDIEKINSLFKGREILNFSGAEEESREITLRFNNEENIRMYHYQDCCENVYLEDISGNVNLDGAIFYEIIEKDCNKEPLRDYDESYTWTFYTIRTSNGYLDLRWYGSSNGYYSESVEVEAYYISKKDNL